MFNGALSAFVTPFRDGEVDERALRDLVEWQIQSGIDGLVPCGSTGESATLTHSEHEQVIKHRHPSDAPASAGGRRHRLELDRRSDPPHRLRARGRR